MSDMNSEETHVCFICLDHSPVPISSGCACRGSAGYVHMDCMVKAAEQSFVNNRETVWFICHVCCGKFTGDLHYRLAEAWMLATNDKNAYDEERIHAQLNMVNSLCEKRMFTEAQHINNDILQVKIKKFGEHDIKTLTMQKSIAKILFQEKKFEECEAMLTRILEIQKKNLGHTHSFTLSTENDLKCRMAIVLINKGQYKEAEKFQSRVVEITRNVLGRDNLSTIRNECSLAICYFLLGMYTEAEDLLQRVVESQQRILGKEHPESLGNARLLSRFMSKDASLKNGIIAELYIV